MTRLAHIILLLLSLAIIVRIGLSGPGSFGEEAGGAVQEEEQGEVPGEMIFNPEPPSLLPDLREGYVFSESRELLESDVDAFNKKGGKKAAETSVSAVDLEQVFYSGSIIIGGLRKALVTYPAEQRTVKKGAKRGRKGRTPRKYMQLDQGGEFMGFLVASVEEDRIVFERDGERVEKFLHDQSRDRIVVKGKARKPAGKAAAGKKGTTRRAVVKPPVVEATPRKPPPREVLLQRRSQRLLRRDSSFMKPPPSGTPPLATSASR